MKYLIMGKDIQGVDDFFFRVSEKVIAFKILFFSLHFI